MKIKLEHNGSIIEIEHRPMALERFKAVCTVTVFALYVGMTWVVALLCGFYGLLWQWFFTVIIYQHCLCSALSNGELSYDTRRKQGAPDRCCYSNAS